MIRIFISTALIIFTSPVFAKNSSKNQKAQVLNFDGMSIKNSKGAPRDAFASSKEKTDFEYFFKTKVSFKKKVIESLEVVRWVHQVYLL